MSIKVTEIAVKEMKRVMDEQDMSQEEFSLKVGVSGGGCSGFQYSLGFEKIENLDKKTYHVSEQHGMKVAIDKKSDLFLDGTTLDFYTDLDKRGFVFDNPQAVKKCGCGSSFSC